MSIYQHFSTKIAILERHIALRNGSQISDEPSQPWRFSVTSTFEHIELVFYRFLMALVRIGLIIKGAPSSNFHVFTQAGKDGVYICNYTYCHYKSFHNTTKYKSLAIIVAATTILSLIVALIFPGEPRARAASYNFSQTNWTDGLDSGTYPNHTSNQTNWTKYSVKDDNLTASATDLKLVNTASNFLDTTEESSQFGGGTHSGTGVSGTGAAASVASCDNLTLSNRNGGCWFYKRPLTISGSTAGAQTNYQVQVTLTTAVMGNPYTNVKTDGSDIRFANSSDVELSYWIESWSNIGTSSIWVKVDFIPASPSTATINMYYGNSSAASASNSTNTFMFFDDFSVDFSRTGGLVDSTEWLEISRQDGSYFFVVDGELNVYGQDNWNWHELRTKSAFPRPVIFEWSQRIPSQDFDAVIGYGFPSTVWTDINYNSGLYFYTNPISRLLDEAGSSIFVQDSATSQTLKMALPPSAGFKMYVDGTLYETNTTYAQDNWNFVINPQEGFGRVLYMDNLRVRKYASPEPNPETSGSETALAAGTFTSSIKNQGSVGYWGNIVFNTTLNGGTVAMKVRTSNSATMTGAPDWSTCNAITSGTNIAGNNCVTSPAQYVQYQATLTYGTSSPSLDDVTIYYGGYAPSATLTSSAFNTQNAGNILSKLTWTENLPANTDIKFQIRTAPDSGSNTPGTWTAWCGPDNATAGTCNSAAYFTAPTGTETVDDINRDGYSNQWIQYKVWLTSSDGVSTPTLSGVSPEYVINTAPAVASVTASQGSDGVVSIGYNISDAEETTVNVSLLADIGVTLNEVLANSTDPGGGAVTVSSATLLPASGTIQIENEQITYTGKSGNDLTGATRAANSTKYAGHASGLAVWIKGTTVASAGDTVTNGTIALTGITSTPIAKTASWTIKTDLPSVYFASAKVRVSANDSQVGNPAGTGDSVAFTLDTKNPAYTSYAVKVDSISSPQLANNISANAGETATYMRFSNSDITGLSCSDSSPSWETYAATKAYSLSPDANGVATVYWQFKDDNCNMISGYSATPRNPINGRANDISVPPSSKYKLLVWWDAVPDPGNFSKYNVYRCDRATTDPAAKCDSVSNYSLLTTITSRTINYCIDEGDGDCADNGNSFPDITTTYYYKITAEDIDGISPYSTAASGLLTYPDIAGTPNGSTVGEADTTAPVISFTSSGSNPLVTDTAASFTYSATDANGVVFLSVAYELSITPPASYTKESANPSIITSGQSGAVTLSGLASNTKYYYKVKARDNSGNTSEIGPYFFITTIDSVAPLAISTLSAPFANLAATSLVLTWTAPGDNEDIGTASSYDIRYSTISASDISTNWATATQIANEPLPMIAGSPQSMVISGLTPSTTYYFAIKTKDEIPNTSLISNIVTVTTPAQADIEIPAITDVSSGTPTATSVIVTWTTANKASSSLVDFGATISYGTTQGNSSELTTSHSVTLAGLIPSTAYKFRVKSVSFSGNTGANDNGGLGYSFTTVSSSAGTLPVITSVSSSSITATSAIITWTTSGAASDSIVGYNVDPGNIYTLEVGNSSTVESHSVVLASLAPSTKYYYRVKSRSGDQLASASSDINGDFNFTTLPGTDSIPPYISSMQVTTITSNKATVTWTTSENADSYVDFGIAAGVYSSTQGSANDSTTSHSVILTSLTPETTYYFRVRSADAAGNSASSVGVPFDTTSGPAVDCPSRPGSSCQACETCPLTDITAPVVSGIKVADIGFNTATVTWSTDEESDSIVEYDTVSFGIKQSYGYSNGNRGSSKSHSIVLSSLDSATTYYFRVSSADAKGNVAKSDTQSFKTIAVMEAKDKGEAVAADLKKEFEDIAQTLIKDNLATEENIKDIIARISNPPAIGSEGPVVKDIKNYGATIVWKTDRKANSVVKFKPANLNNGTVGIGDNWQEMGKMDSFDFIHEVPLLGLAPSTPYTFFVQSQDILGGVAKSEPQSFTTASLSSIFNVAVTDLNLTEATINWETSNLSTSSLEWGLSPSYGNYKDKGTEKVQKHSILLDNLSSGAAYHYRVRSVEETGTILSSDDYAFITPNLPQITKYTLGEIKDTSVALSWTSNIPINSSIRYTDTETGETKIQGEEEKTTDHALTLSALEAGKSYKIEIQGYDDKGNMAEIPAFEVQTGTDNVSPELTQIRSQSAILGGAEDKVQAIISWRTNELSDTKVLWDLGSTKGDKFANETKLDSNLTTNHISVVTSFKPGTVYRFRVVSSDKFGNISVSPDYTVLTPIRRQSVIQMIVNQFEGVFSWMTRLGR